MDQTYSEQQEKSPHIGRGALDAFFNLLTLVSIGWYSVALGGALFQIINKFYGRDIYGFSRFSRSALTFEISSVLIMTPVLLFLFGYLHRFYKEQKLNHQSGIHRWLTYFLLFVASVNILGSLIALIARLLEGDYTVGSLLKILVVFVIASGVFGYLFFDLRRKDYSVRSPVSIISTIIVIVASAATIVSGILIAGSPKEARLRNFDLQRTSDLSELRFFVENYYRENEKLPEDLTATQLKDIKDPESGQPYEYRIIDESTYELCAIFSLSAEESENSFRRFPGEDEWHFHEAGKQCFQKKIPADLIDTVKKRGS